MSFSSAGGATTARNTTQPANANDTMAPGIHSSARSAAIRAAAKPSRSQPRTKWPYGAGDGGGDPVSSAIRSRTRPISSTASW